MNLSMQFDEGLNGLDKRTPETINQGQDDARPQIEAASESPNEEELDDGLGIFVKRRTIYHGSGVSGIEKFNKAEEDTVGSGVYFTSEAKDAIGYARRRARRRKDASPVIYETSIENMRLLDLRKDENIKKILDGFKLILRQELEKSDLKWNWKMKLEEVMEIIEAGSVGIRNLREVTWSTGHLFSEYVTSLGYDGLVTLEGGEGNDVGNHDTYLVFDPNKAAIKQEHKIL